jgi:hypothetical protein
MPDTILEGTTQGSFQQSLVEIDSPLFSNMHNRSKSAKVQSSYGQNCSILSQNAPKFELLKHNDELLNIYYGIFYEL